MALVRVSNTFPLDTSHRPVLLCHDARFRCSIFGWYVIKLDDLLTAKPETKSFTVYNNESVAVAKKADRTTCTLSLLLV